MQQSYAKVSGVLDSLSPISLVEDALRINDAALARHHVHVVLEYAEVPDVLVDRHKALQILVNLLHNAKHALQEMDRPDKQLVVAVAGNGADRVRIIVRDNGIGIPPENLTRIFAHGFTTKKEGHGFGLHSSALAAKEMGGSLNAHSDGPYRGATFTLELPACPPKQLAA
jgi:C4-dicarboxylate-specific signal transduction histidine kinase